jgi:hypothetical protein
VVRRAAGKRPFLSAFFGPLICWIGRPGKPRVPRSPPDSNEWLREAIEAECGAQGGGRGGPTRGKGTLRGANAVFLFPPLQIRAHF